MELKQVSTEIINGEDQPVLCLPDGTGRYVQQDNMLLSVEGAKMFKRGPYPLHPDLRTILEEVAGPVPLPLRSPADQTQASQNVLKVLIRRLINLGLPSTN